jgi:SAM-dependent methyltransferase
LALLVDVAGYPHEIVQNSYPCGCSDAFSPSEVLGFFERATSVSASHRSVGSAVKLCLSCDLPYDQLSWECPHCHATPASIGKFIAFAPESANETEGFRSTYFSDLSQLEARNFWFRARNRLIVWAMSRYFRDAASFLEIGCGTGYVLSGVAEAFPEMTLWGSELLSAGLEFAAARVERAHLCQMDARRIPFEGEFDVIGAFDVIEHIVEDEMVLNRVFRAVRPGGGIIISVPQHAFLWSQQDVYACHVRRYSRADMMGKVSRAGFVERVTSFVTLPFPLLLLSRLRKRVLADRFDPLDELRVGYTAGAILERTLSIEQRLIMAGASFPFGGSLLLVGRKA